MSKLRILYLISPRKHTSNRGFLENRLPDAAVSVLAPAERKAME
jgi:hypothetical protein